MDRTEGSVFAFPAFLTSPQALTPWTSAHHRLDHLRQLPQLKKAGTSIMCTALFHRLQQIYKGRQHLALIMLVEFELQ